MKKIMAAVAALIMCMTAGLSCAEETQMEKDHDFLGWLEDGLNMLTDYAEEAWDAAGPAVEAGWEKAQEAMGAGFETVMEKLTEATLSVIDQVNSLGLYDINSNMCHCSYTFSDSLPSKECDPDNPATGDGWAFNATAASTLTLTPPGESPDATAKTGTGAVSFVPRKSGTWTATLAYGSTTLTAEIDVRDPGTVLYLR